jgi:nitrogenase molybdenum-cofactor synthesis protein NifE
MAALLEERRHQVNRKGAEPWRLDCDRKSVAGSVSLRSCVFCGSRVVLYPVADALHLVHGPIGCAAYTWDIRGSLSSGPELHRISFSTDLQEQDVINGGEKKLYHSLIELIDEYAPKAAFVYATCIAGLIGDDIGAICKRVSREKGIPVIPVESPGFAGTKKTGYQAACDALYRLVGEGDINGIPRLSINILGDFNIAGETWIVRDYYERMGIRVVATVTGDGRVDDIRRMHGASLNVVQCSGSMMSLARRLEQERGQPFCGFPTSDRGHAAALYDVARFFGDPEIMAGPRSGPGGNPGDRAGITGHPGQLEGSPPPSMSAARLRPSHWYEPCEHSECERFWRDTNRQCRRLQMLRDICDEGTVIVDDTNPRELCHFLKELRCDVFIGGVKERPIAHKLGLGSAITTTSANWPWRVSSECSILPGKSRQRQPVRSGGSCHARITKFGGIVHENANRTHRHRYPECL